MTTTLLPPFEPDHQPLTGSDHELRIVRAELERLVPPEQAESFYGTLVRQATDEVLDGPRTGRWRYEQLAKTEKAYIGTRLEIILQNTLHFSRGQAMDLSIAGIDVDVKSGVTACMFPTESLGHLCLIILHSDKQEQFSIGLWRCHEEQLNPGKNKDGKRTMNQAGRDHVRWLIRAPLPPHHLARFDHQTRILLLDPDHDRDQRLEALLTRSYQEHEPFPRDVVETIGLSLDQALERLPTLTATLGKQLLRGSVQSERETAARAGITLLDRHYLVI